MDKPLDLLIEEGKLKIAGAINDTKLPAFLLELIVKEIYNEILILKSKQLKSSKEKYEKSLSEQEVANG